ncbi:MAG: xanthine dehydrogenase molybdopterin binding subunit [Myxococcota bacterium]
MAEGSTVVTPLHRPAPHESGLRHATGEAKYVDDLPAPAGMLVAQLVPSTIAHGRIRSLDVSKARAVPGVVAVLTARDVPGENNVGPVIHDEEFLARDEVQFLGHAVALVVGESYEACRAGAAAVKVELEPLPAILTLEDAIEKGSWLSDEHWLSRGDVAAALPTAEVRLTGEVRTGGQDHFYLETQATLAVPDEHGCLKLFSSTQHPSEVQALVAHALHLGRHQVVVEVPRMGGGFGGKETQAANFACLAALAAYQTGRPVKVWLNRDQDMLWTGKRHPFLTRFDAGFTKDGVLVGLDAQLFSNGGFSNDLSRAILDRALFHADNGYFLPNVRLRGRVAKTNLPSNTAFRGFGGPQGMAVIEHVMNLFCERTGMDPVEVRRKNFYGPAPRNLTPYHQEVKDNRLPRLFDELLVSSDYRQRRAEVEAFNAKHPHAKRGLALTPVKFGISFTTSFLNQAGALVVLYADATAQLNHGGTEMGQGLHTKMLMVCAHELGLRPERIRVMNTATDKVPNTSATAASSGSDLNGQAVKQACETIRERLRPVAARLLGAAPADVVFADGEASAGGRRVPMEKVTQEAYLAQISLSATGYYRTPDISFDRATGRGKPFHYFAYGAAVTEVELSGLTGEHRVRRADLLQDVGRSLVPTIDRGQVEGAFIQGLGWLTNEELRFDDKGWLRTHSPDTYKIPSFGDAPAEFRVALLENAAQSDVIHGSKAVGEPPLMLALSVVAALREAVAAFGPKGREVQLDMPCTPEALLFAIEAARR